jgi:hypothetical protein
VRAAVARFENFSNVAREPLADSLQFLERMALLEVFL